jgi:predicted DNA-binding protein with PD1-like motif
MQNRKIKKDTWVIRIKRGEDIIKSIKDFCKKNRIEGGFFYGVGACDKVELAHYDVGKKKYSSIKYDEALEMASINGNIGKEKDLIVHAHAVFSNKKMNAYAGHLVEARVSGTAEIIFTVLPKLKKKYDDETGLKLFDLK